MKERRQYIRFPVAHDMATVISIDIKTSQGNIRHDEAVICDLSAGGIALLTSADFKVGSIFELVLQLSDLRTKPIKCEVVRCENRPEINKVAMRFLKICEEDKKHINKIAQDYSDCETKLALGVRDVCLKTCHYYKLCNKDVKI